jgi:hypothetical protein
VNSLEQLLTRRDGLEFVQAWEQRRQTDLDLLQESGVSLGSLLGNGSRGEVWAGRWKGIDVAVKLFAYPEERAGQVRALGHWSGFAPEVFATVGSTAVILERLVPATSIAGTSNDLALSLELLRLLIDASPRVRPEGAALLTDHFGERLVRARERNNRNRIFSPEEIGAIEEAFPDSGPERSIVCHGDFGGNLVFGPEPMVIDPRQYLWGDPHCDIAKWVLFRGYGGQIDEGIGFFVDAGFSEVAIRQWLLVIAYDDGSALALLRPGDQRVPRYREVASKLLEGKTRLSTR